MVRAFDESGYDCDIWICFCSLLGDLFALALDSSLSQDARMFSALHLKYNLTLSVDRNSGFGHWQHWAFVFLALSLLFALVWTVILV
jgi:hypothetical protein